MTTAIIIITVLFSLLCFNNGRLFARFSLRPYYAVHYNQWDRLMTHGFVHGDFTHLLINMLVFWSFGTHINDYFNWQYEETAGAMDGNLKFILLYLGGIVVASSYDVVKRRDDPNYTSVGASGAVSAVVFTSIFLNPWGKLYLFGLLPLSGIVFGALYLLYESYSTRRKGDRINHHAHILGALYGFLFPMLTDGFGEINTFIDKLLTRL